MVSQGGLGGAGANAVGPETTAAIESLTVLLVVTADRPTASSVLKRTDGMRILWATPARRSNRHLPLGLVHTPWPAVSTERFEPLALHLAGRGPPLAPAA